MSIRISPTSPDGFLAHSHSGDDWRTCRDHVRDRLGLPREIGHQRRQEPRQRPRAPEATNDAENAKKLVYAARIVREICPLRGTPGEVYLRDTRKIDTAAVADVLERTDAIGWHPAVLFRQPGHPLDGQRLGCIVGVMTDALTGRPTGAISRSFISERQKVAKAMTLGRPAGIVRLSRDDEVCAGLHLAEGLETTLDLMARGLRPAFSTGSTGLMASFPPLAGIEALTIIADNDVSGAGERAARAAEAAWLGAGREVRIFMADEIGDFNDRSQELSA